jgi:hypothetical protein
MATSHFLDAVGIRTVVLLAAFLAAPQMAASEEAVPTLNVEPSCRFAATLGQDPQKAFNTCMEDEKSARAELAKGWAQYASSDRKRCLELTHVGEQPSYVDVLECVAIAKDASELEKKERPD